jgi:Nucleotidyltransferase domain
MKVPDVSFTAEQVAAATGVLAQLDGAELAFLGGSLAVGLGHAMSDIDLYVVGPDLPERELSYQHRGVWVHVNPLSAAKVRELAALATEYRATGMDRSQLAADAKTLNALVRLATGWRLHATPEWTELLATLSDDVIRQVLTARHSNVFVAYAEDAHGALRTGDLLTATTASHLAVESACEATLASAGDLYLGPKFLFRRLARNPVTAPWSMRIWELSYQTVDPGSRAAVEAIVTDRLFAGSQLVAWCAVDGWEQPLAALPDPAPMTRAGGPLRSGLFAPVRFVDGWALIGPDDGYEVSEGTVRLWRRLDGRPWPELLAALPSEEPSLAGHTAGEVGSAVTNLAKFGVVEPGWISGVAGSPPPALVIHPAPQFSCHPRQA